MKSKLKLSTVIIFAVLLLLVAFYIISFLSTNKLVSYVEDVFGGKISALETENTPYNKYNFSKDIEFDTVDVDIDRAIVAHNFTDGYMIVYYKVKAFDSNGNTVYGSATTFPHQPTIWKIHKENGNWEIVEIYEHP